MLEKKEKGTISIFERETSSFPLDYGIGNLSTGEIQTLKKLCSHSLLPELFTRKIQS